MAALQHHRLRTPHPRREQPAMGRHAGRFLEGVRQVRLREELSEDIVCTKDVAPMLRFADDGIWHLGRMIAGQSVGLSPCLWYATRMEIGLYTFLANSADPHTGQAVGTLQRYREVLSLARFAEQVGLEVFGVGEHHRLDLAGSSPAVVLAAIGATTRRIRLVSAVTILSTLDPVRVFEDYATADLCSEGRVEIIAGRGAYPESFPLFGYDPADSDALFAEHLDLLLQLNRSERVTWQGHFRPPLRATEISPRPAQVALPIWLGVGGTLESAERAARLGLPLTLANISQPPAKLAPQITRYRELARSNGHGPERTRIAVAGHLHVARDSQQARERFYPYYSSYFRQHAPHRINSADVPRAVYDERGAPTGPLFVGSPQEIIDKVLYERELFRHDRFLVQVDLGALPHRVVMEVVELLARDVAPVLRRESRPS